MFEALKITSALQVNMKLWQSAILYLLLFSFLSFFFKGTLQNVVSFFYGHT